MHTNDVNDSFKTARNSWMGSIKGI